MRRSGCGIVSLEAGDSAAKLPRKLSSFHRIFTYNFSPRPPGMSLLGCIVVFFFFLLSFCLLKKETFSQETWGKKSYLFLVEKISASFVQLYFCVNGVVKKKGCAWGVQNLTCLVDKKHHD